MKNGTRWLIAGLLSCAALAGVAAVEAPLNPVRPAATPTNTVATKSVRGVNDTATRPLWNELTATQQNALAPLASDWNNIEVFRKKKWLEIGNRFVTMNPDEQLRVQERMRDWAKLTPDERRVAREIYTRTKKLNADEKSAQWQQYQELPEEQKKKLASDIAAKKRVSNLPAAPLHGKPVALPKPFEKAVPEKPAVTPSSPAPLPIPPASEIAPLAIPQAATPSPVPTRQP